MNRVTSQVDFVHNGNEISGTLFSHYEKGTEKYNTIMFKYKEYGLHISLEEDESYWTVAPLHCKVIDKIEVNGYKQYDKYLSELYSIELNH
ncbi:hypothetical protein, partial [Peribacillus simplex]|uniref:hypothetical protein n=1 Tax=Peribacillus simplex TaxID=1478 RepID=UPI000BD7A3F9